MRDDRIGGHQTHTTQNCLRKFFKLKGDDGRWKHGSSQSYRDCAKCWFSIRRFKAKILAANYKSHNKFINRMYDNDSIKDKNRDVEEKYSDWHCMLRHHISK